MRKTPQLSEDCAACSHMFAVHFVRHDQVQGCAGLVDNQHGGDGNCSCTGFAIRWTKPSRGRTPTVPFWGEAVKSQLEYERG